MKTKLGNRFALFVEIILTIFIVYMMGVNSFNNVKQEVGQYESGLEDDYEKLIEAYTTDFKMMVNEITPKIEKGLSFDEMQKFLESKEKSFQAAIGADVYDGISLTYKGGYAHSWGYGDYSDYDPYERPWYITAQEANGEIAVTAPYVTYLEESELAGTDEYIILTLTQKYNDEISFCYDIKTFVVNELLSKRYNRYDGTFAMMYDETGYVLSSTKSDYYCHNVYKNDEIVSDGLVKNVKSSEKNQDKIALNKVNGKLEFIYFTVDKDNNNYYIAIPFWTVMEDAFLGIILIALLLIIMEIWIFTHTKKQLRTELKLQKVENTSQMKQDFLSRMSHDMRTPMNGILGLSELSAEINDVEALKENMEKIHSAGEYLLGLINDSLDLQKIESGKLVLNPSVVSTSQLIGTSVDMIKLSAKKKNVDFIINNINANIESYIKIDVMRMRQIFINLLSNAIKFTPEGGKVVLSLEVLGRDGNVVHGRLIVSDTGIGMSEDFIKNRLFTPFSQENTELTNNIQGTGLGLSIVKKLVEVMGATITVESELGKGTSFIVDIDFECVDEPNDGLKQTEQTTETAGGYDLSKLEGKTILLAEDHPLNAEIAMKILGRTGCAVTWVKDGNECVNQFSQSSLNQYDLILMDIRMPNMDGLEATATIRALERADAGTVTIIAMSANAYDEDKKKSMEVGMDGHLSKPIVIDELYQTLCKFLQ